MSTHHKAFIKELKKLEPKKKNVHYGDSYTGSTHFYYGVSVPQRRILIKNWRKENKHASNTEVIALIDSLMGGRSHEEKTMAAYLLGYAKDARQDITIKQLDHWLDELVGWAEIDALCQNIFQAEELLKNWSEWKKFLIDLSKDININKRRASLVFLVGPTWKSNEKKLHDLAYQNINQLKDEKDILITKAISWLLRSMVDTQPKEVSLYLNKNEDSLPTIALRETRRKLETGKKNK